MKRYNLSFCGFALVLLCLMFARGVEAQDVCQGDSCDNMLSSCLERCQPSPYQNACRYLCLGPYTNCTDSMNRGKRLTVWRRGEFFLRLLAEQMSPAYDWEYPESDFNFRFGSGADIPLPGNYLNGSLTHSLNLWQPHSGMWLHATNPSLPYELLPGEVPTPREKQFGLFGDIPVPGDFLYQVWRPASGTWFRQQSSGCADPTAGHAVESIQWGLPGDYPLVGRFKIIEPDSKTLPKVGETQIAIFRPSDGGWYVRTKNARSGVDLSRLFYKQWGMAEDHPLPADYDGDGFTDIAVWRPSTGTWFVCSSTSDYDCSQASIFQFGLPTDVPIQLDHDEDGKADFAVWRPSDGRWYIHRSSDSVVEVVQWGRRGDVPISLGIRDRTQRLYPGY